MHAVPQVAPWVSPLTQGERTIIYYFLVFAGLALFAQFIRTLTSVRDVSPKYRGAMFASLGITGAAAISYAVLVHKFDVGYTRTGGDATGAGAIWMPNENAIQSWAPRYMDWSVTVPLLMIQLVAVSTLVGLAATRMRAVLVACAFLMIFTGYLGGVVLGNGNSLTALWTWGLISTVFTIVIYVGVIVMMLMARNRMPGTESTRTFQTASILLLAVFFVYPIVYGFQGYTEPSGAWTAAAQISLSVADVIAKVGFGALIHKLAHLRTAEDVKSGETHPEPIYVSGDKKSDAVLPPMHDPYPVSDGSHAAGTPTPPDLVPQKVPVGR